MMSAPVSFGFSKKVQQKKLVDSKLRDESTKDKEEELDFVKGVIGNEIQGSLKKPEAKKEWVVPLIRRNVWRGDVKQKPENSSTDAESATHGDSGGPPAPEEALSPEALLEKQALKELLDAAGDPGSAESNAYEIPLLLQNKIPSGFEEDDNMDVSLRAEQSSLDDYEEYPIEHFGMAMLRGMGWKETEGIGRTNKGVILIKEPTLRPKGLGLGAERPQANKDAVSSASGKGREENLTLKIGAYGKINHGANKGLYGKVESFDEDNNRVILKLALTSKMVAVSKFHMEVVSESEFKSKSKVLNNEKYEEYKKVHDEKDATHRERRSQQDEDFLDMSTVRHRSSSSRAADNSLHTSRHTNGRDRDDSRDRDRSSSRRSHKDKSSSHKHSKKSKKEKKKRKHRRRSSSSSSSSSASDDNRKSRHKKERRGSS